MAADCISFRETIPGLREPPEALKKLQYATPSVPSTLYAGMPRALSMTGYAEMRYYPSGKVKNGLLTRAAVHAVQKRRVRVSQSAISLAECARQLADPESSVKTRRALLAAITHDVCGDESPCGWRLLFNTPEPRQVAEDVVVAFGELDEAEFRDSVGAEDVCWHCLKLVAFLALKKWLVGSARWIHGLEEPHGTRASDVEIDVLTGRFYRPYQHHAQLHKMLGALLQRPDFLRTARELYVRDFAPRFEFYCADTPLDYPESPKTSGKLSTALKRAMGADRLPSSYINYCYYLQMRILHDKQVVDCGVVVDLVEKTVVFSSTHRRR